MKLRHLLALLPWLLMPALSYAASVQATLNRSTVQLGETVTLNLRINDYDGNLPTPDLGALNQDFSILDGRVFPRARMIERQLKKVSKQRKRVGPVPRGRGRGQRPQEAFQ